MFKPRFSDCLNYTGFSRNIKNSVIISVLELLSQMYQQILTFNDVFDTIIKRIDFVLRNNEASGCEPLVFFLFKNHFVPLVPFFLVHKKSADNQHFRQVLKIMYHLHFFRGT